MVAVDKVLSSTSCCTSFATSSSFWQFGGGSQNFLCLSLKECTSSYLFRSWSRRLVVTRVVRRPHFLSVTGSIVPFYDASNIYRRRDVAITSRQRASSSEGRRLSSSSSSRRASDEVFSINEEVVILCGEQGEGEAKKREVRTGSSSESTESLAVEEDSIPTSSKKATPSNTNNSPLSALINALGVAWHEQIAMPISNFGFGKRSIWEGGVGLFLVTGAFLLAVTLSWIKGMQVRAKSSRYQAVIEFSQAAGITVGTPLRIRGVDVGSVVSVRPSLERIDVIVEVMDASVLIPRNALVEVNQSGLISETLIDVTPKPPIPRPTAGPLDPGCHEEGLIVCDRQHIKGVQGVSLDELVGICTKLAKQMDSQGVDNMFIAMDKFSVLAEEAKPLLVKVNEMAESIAPMLKEVQQGDLVKNLEALTKVASEATSDLRSLNNAVLTRENLELLRQSISTLTRTLEHIESISNDVSGLTGDPGTKYNLRQLIQSLSRLVTD